MRINEKVPALGKSYTWDGEKAVFEDGVRYSVPELLCIATPAATPEALRAIHAIKAEFDGVVYDPKTERLRDHRKRARSDFNYWLKNVYLNRANTGRWNWEPSREMLHLSWKYSKP